MLKEILGLLCLILLIIESCFALYYQQKEDYVKAVYFMTFVILMSVNIGNL
jgi:hypothetical protein